MALKLATKLHFHAIQICTIIPTPAWDPGILGSLAQALAKIHFLIHFGYPRRKRENVLLTHPQLLHPILKSPTSLILKMLSSLTCIQNTDLDTPIPKQATTRTIRACCHM
eukprot:1151010-Pelagomonas_calceolata.AAC.4